MRRIILIAFLTICSYGVMSAQDIIYMFDSSPLEAKVLEIGDDYICYRTWDNPDGPVYNTSLSRVVKVVFNNGTVKYFTPAPMVGDVPYGYPGGYHGAYPLHYSWGGYYDPYGRIDQSRVADYIGYSLYGGEYMKARNQFLWGTSLTFIGAGGFILSLIGHILNEESNNFAAQAGLHSSGSSAGFVAGYILSAGCLSAGIPLWVKGNKGLRKIMDDYNKTYINPDKPKSTSPNLSLGATNSGVGFAFNF